MLRPPGPLELESKMPGFPPPCFCPFVPLHPSLRETQPAAHPYTLRASISTSQTALLMFSKATVQSVRQIRMTSVPFVPLMVIYERGNLGVAHDKLEPSPAVIQPQ